VSNIGYTPVNKAGDTMTGALTVTGSNPDDTVFLGTSGGDQIVGGRTGGSFGIKTKAGSNGNIVLGGSNAVYLQANSLTGLLMDSSGRVTLPYQPSFFAFSDTPGWGWSGVLPFDSTQWNVGNHYNTSTKAFTAPVSGKYFFRVNGTPSGSFGNFFWIIRKNGVDQYYIAGTDALSQYEIIHGTQIMNLSAGDVVDIRGTGSHGGMYGGALDNNFSGYLIG
jgi:hypothetical protein